MITLTDEEYVKLNVMADYQVPHKPDWDSDGYDIDGHEVWDAHCPKCGARVDDFRCDKFCPECGQRIDWNDGKER